MQVAFSIRSLPPLDTEKFSRWMSFEPPPPLGSSRWGYGAVSAGRGDSSTENLGLGASCKQRSAIAAAQSLNVAHSRVAHDRGLGARRRLLGARLVALKCGARGGLLFGSTPLQLHFVLCAYGVVLLCLLLCVQQTCLCKHVLYHGSHTAEVLYPTITYCAALHCTALHCAALHELMYINSPQQHDTPFPSCC